MTTESGEPKGLQQTLKECRFNCTSVCPFKNNNCCMACILSKQEDFTNQISMLETVIWEAGDLCVFLPKFHCKLNPIEMYWGRNKFQQAKDAAIKALDSCPIDVIRCFINCSWQWMSVYHMGLTGNAAQWAVCKQKGHHSVSRMVIMHLDAVLN
ncbi:hypothetical protein BYT27DRAFT_7220844 [Phlegmacium glaucopus]|nr:hypothetical protein BYT27DRAFT_7220844 [Phlegmacium glaucopus]